MKFSNSQIRLIMLFNIIINLFLVLKEIGITKYFAFNEYKLE